MNRHPLHDAFDQMSHEPSSAFRADLRAQLLDDLVAPATETSDTSDSGTDITITVTQQPIDLDSRRRGRVMLAAAAAVIATIGAGLVLLGRTGNENITTSTTPETVVATTISPTQTTPQTSVPETLPPETVPEAAPITDPPAGPPVDDAVLVAEALITSDQIGEGQMVAQLGMTTSGRPDNWASTNEAFAATPACADYTTTTQPLLANATGTGNIWGGSNSYNVLVSSVTAYPDADIASQAVDAVEAATYPDCFIAFWDAALNTTDPNRNDVTSTLTDTAPLEAHGDRQVEFTITSESTGFAPSPTIFHIVYMQYDRLVVTVVVNEDSLGPDAPNGITQAALRGAVRTVEAALGLD